MSLRHDISWVLIFKAYQSFVESKNKLKITGSKKVQGTMLAAPRSVWCVPIIGFISVDIDVINDDLTLGTSNIIWYINNILMESKKPAVNR